MKMQLLLLDGVFVALMTGGSAFLMVLFSLPSFPSLGDSMRCAVVSLQAIVNFVFSLFSLRRSALGALLQRGRKAEFAQRSAVGEGTSSFISC